MTRWIIKPGQELLPFPKMKKSKRRLKHGTPEEILQHKCEVFLENERLEYLHIPNSFWAVLFKNQAYGAIKECSDYLKGWPDLLIFNEGSYLAVELKSLHGKMSKKQTDKKRELQGHVIQEDEAGTAFERFKQLVLDWRNKYGL